jgi:hypothetical protein
MLIPPDHPPEPRYWMFETSGVLRPAIEAYCNGAMAPQHVTALRAYLRQWMAGPWAGDRADELRAGIDGLTSRDAITAWLRIAGNEGIHPL